LSTYIPTAFTNQPNQPIAFDKRNMYNNKRDAEVAQQVEQRTENPRVISSILILGTF
jgi:hypothetical protein